MPTLLVLKLLLVPSLIGLVTLAGRKWGPQVAGWLSAFPVVAGPILFFIAMERGPDFAATAAVGTLSAVVAIIVFGAAYAWAAIRLGWVGSLLLALVAYALAVAGIKAASLALLGSAIANLILIWLSPRLFPAVPIGDAMRTAPGASPNAELALRMLAGAALAWLVTSFASDLGPRLSGMLAMFPVMGTVLTVFSHRNSGRAFAIGFLRGMLPGWYAFSTFCIVLALILPGADVGLSFTVAYVAATLVQGFSRRWVS